MRSPSRPRRFRVQLVSQAALKRLAALFVVLAILSIWGYLAMFWMPGNSYEGQLPPLTPAEISLQDALKRDVQSLAIEIGIRNSGQYEHLENARHFLTAAFAQSGYDVEQQAYEIEGKPYYNIAVEHRGIEKPDEIVVIGGHYDSVFYSPGANDNGTGVAATLELARLFANRESDRTIRFVAFVNEEPPWFWTENMGSLVYARSLGDRGDNVVAMLSLETMGFFSDEPNSQTYPFPISLLYPDRGNFIAFVGNLGSENLLRSAIGSFRRRARFPSEGVALPGWMPGVGWSDHWAFWQQGYEGIMVTDTAPFRYPYYHTEQDTPDKIDFDKLARVVSGLAEVIDELAGSAE